MGGQGRNRLKAVSLNRARERAERHERDHVGAALVQDARDAVSGLIDGYALVTFTRDGTEAISTRTFWGVRDAGDQFILPSMAEMKIRGSIEASVMDAKPDKDTSA